MSIPVSIPSAISDLSLYFFSLAQYPDEDVLDAGEKERLRRFVPENVKRRFAAAHTRLRNILAVPAQTRPELLIFGAGTFGKPYLESYPHISFSLSHSEDTGFLAVCTKSAEIGADIEKIREGREFRGIASRYFTEPEQLFYDKDPSPETFMQIWTRKEAYTKALGTGLQTPLDSFSVPLGNITEITPMPGTGFSFIPVPQTPPGFAAACCLKVSGK